MYISTESSVKNKNKHNSKKEIIQSATFPKSNTCRAKSQSRKLPCACFQPADVSSCRQPSSTWTTLVEGGVLKSLFIYLFSKELHL